LNTQEFIKALAGKLNISQKETEKLLEQTTKVMRETVTEDKGLTILHLGNFKVKKTPTRSTYIPALDKKAVVPPKNSIIFQTADTLKDKLKSFSRP
jgi:nucleoid DNA-binding protein